METTGDCACPCGENTAEVTTRYLSAEYTDQAMGWATGESGIDSQWRQRFLFACVSGLWRPPSHLAGRYRGICLRRNTAWCEADNHLVPVLSICGAVPPPPLVVMTGHLRHCLTLPTQLSVVGWSDVEVVAAYLMISLISRYSL